MYTDLFVYMCVWLIVRQHFKHLSIRTIYLFLDIQRRNTNYRYIGIMKFEIFIIMYVIPRNTYIDMQTNYYSQIRYINYRYIGIFQTYNHVGQSKNHQHRYVDKLYHYIQKQLVNYTDIQKVSLVKLYDYVFYTTRQLQINSYIQSIMYTIIYILYFNSFFFKLNQIKPKMQLSERKHGNIRKQQNSQLHVQLAHNLMQPQQKNVIYNCRICIHQTNHNIKHTTHNTFLFHGSKHTYKYVYHIIIKITNSQMHRTKIMMVVNDKIL
eukprot:TRINITY_DN207_c3_g2_i2.p1 TRINITY_DN207_c3_g2~~TRINITY_DN207_c3_g2_i2.p1  ORF type:complete len:284 (+),score=-45.88 TRINITY_DN207_c3_g2_i2:55-852(+)